MFCHSNRKETMTRSFKISRLGKGMGKKYSALSFYLMFSVSQSTWHTQCVSHTTVTSHDLQAIKQWPSLLSSNFLLAFILIHSLLSAIAELLCVQLHYSQTARLNGKKKNYTLTYFSGLNSVPPIYNLLNNTLLKTIVGFLLKTNLTCFFSNQSTMGNSAIPFSLLHFFL